jgi:hypothetical protein
MELFNNMHVNYIGTDNEFKQHFTHDSTSENLILILNSSMWVSTIIANCKQHLASHVKTFYIGINRYCILGNDTNKVIRNTENHSTDLIQFITNITEDQGFIVTKSGMFDQDLGKYFNFVQPLTWVYGYNTSN